MFNVPILLIVWRREDLVSKLISSLRHVRPSLIYVSCDGPKPKDSYSEIQVNNVRKVIELEIDWPCTVKRNYSSTNKGCRLAVIDGLKWFFDYEEEGIILEDDCIPHHDFFAFCIC